MILASWKKGPTHSPTSVSPQHQVRMAERSKALRSGRSPLLWAWVRIPLLTTIFFSTFKSSDSRVAQWKRAGPITQRSVDRNYALLTIFIPATFMETKIIGGLVRDLNPGPLAP